MNVLPPAIPEQKALRSLVSQLRKILAGMDSLVARHESRLAGVEEELKESAENLLHYLALRKQDLRPLQDALAQLGLSSLGRCESHARSSVAATLRILERLIGRTKEVIPVIPAGAAASRLEKRALELLGPRPSVRRVRIMVTMPSHAADDDDLIRTLLDQGMNVARINCAHDDARVWVRIARRVRALARASGRTCRILMDLGGPKLRTGPVRSGPAVLKIKPFRDTLGHLIRPARIWLTCETQACTAPEGADAVLPLAAGQAFRPTAGGTLEFVDARSKSRNIRLTHITAQGAWGTLEKTAYLLPGTVLRLAAGKKYKAGGEWIVGALSARPAALDLHIGDQLLLTRSLEEGHGRLQAVDGAESNTASIGCTLPEAFRDVKVGEPIWLDDGKIGGVIERKSKEKLHVRVTHTPPGGARLGADKGVNLPLTELHLSAFTEKDREDLRTIAREADVVALSFVENPADLRLLRRELARLGGRCKGVVLKIETRRAFANLPSLLLELLREPHGGVMIARGDLAVECGFERLAEVQEEMLWICEAAQVPVIWATQVLETLAKKGAASRAEITDAAMSSRAECVMLNKGSFIASALRTIDDILRRMEGHQSKKRSMMRPLSIAVEQEPLHGPLAVE